MTPSKRWPDEAVRALSVHLAAVECARVNGTPCQHPDEHYSLDPDDWLPSVQFTSPAYAVFAALAEYVVPRTQPDAEGRDPGAVDRDRDYPDLVTVGWWCPRGSELGHFEEHREKGSARPLRVHKSVADRVRALWQEVFPDE